MAVKSAMMYELEKARTTPGRWSKDQRAAVAAELKNTKDLHAGTPLHRVRLAGWLKTSEALVMGLILYSWVVVIAETDSLVDSDRPPRWVAVSNVVLITLYTVEVSLRLYAFQGAFFDSGFNIFDLAVVSVDIVLMCLGRVVGEVPNITAMRILRVLRFARAYRMFALLPELHCLVRGLAGTVMAVFWGIVMLTSVLTFWGVLAVQLIHPINRQIAYDGCERCPRAYSSVWESVLTILQQVVAGDSWGTVTLQVIQREHWALLFFVAVFVCVIVLVMNLILAVIVQKAMEAHRDDEQFLMQQLILGKEAKYKAAKEVLLKMCSNMDVDENGTITMEELLAGFDEDESFRHTMQVMDIRKDDLHQVFSILDQDNSGDVNYAEFVDQLHRMKSHDDHTLMIFMMHQIMEVRKRLDDGRAGAGAERDLTGHPRPRRPSSSPIGEQKMLGVPSKDQYPPPGNKSTVPHQAAIQSHEQLAEAVAAAVRQAEAQARLLASICEALPRLAGSAAVQEGEELREQFELDICV